MVLQLAIIAHGGSSGCVELHIRFKFASHVC